MVSIREELINIMRWELEKGALYGKSHAGTKLPFSFLKSYTLEYERFGKGAEYHRLISIHTFNPILDSQWEETIFYTMEVSDSGVYDHRWIYNFERYHRIAEKDMPKNWKNHIIYDTFITIPEIQLADYINKTFGINIVTIGCHHLEGYQKYLVTGILNVYHGTVYNTPSGARTFDIAKFKTSDKITYTDDNNRTKCTIQLIDTVKSVSLFLYSCNDIGDKNTAQIWIYDESMPEDPLPHFVLRQL